MEITNRQLEILDAMQDDRLKRYKKYNDTYRSLISEFFEYELNLIIASSRADFLAANRKTKKYYSDGADKSVCLNIERLVEEFYQKASVDRALYIIEITGMGAWYIDDLDIYPRKFMKHQLLHRDKDKIEDVRNLAVKLINNKNETQKLLLGCYLVGEIKHLAPRLNLPRAEIPNYTRIISGVNARAFDHQKRSNAIGSINSLIEKGKWELALYLINSMNIFLTSSMIDDTIFLVSNIITKVDPGKVDQVALSKLDPDVMPDFLAEKMIGFSLGCNNVEKAEIFLERLKKIGYLESKINRAEDEIRSFKLQGKCMIQGVDPEKLNQMTGEEFERLIVSKLKHYGLKAEITKATGDFGADIIAEDISGTRFAIQCKRYASRVNLKAVQEVVSSCSYYACDIGVVITNNTFLKSAVELAKKNSVELWDRSKLIAFLAEESFETDMLINFVKSNASH